MTMLRPRAAVIAALVLFVAGGCAGRAKTPAAAYQTAAPETLLARLADAAAAIDGLKALATLKLHAQPFEARLVFRRPDRVRLVGFNPFGGALFDFAADANAAALRLPGRDAVDVDPYAPLALAPATQVRGSDLLRLVQVVAGPHVAAGERAVFEQDGRYYVFHVVNDDAAAPALRRRLWIDRVDLRPARVDFFGADGRRDATVRLEDYRPLALANGGATRFPFHVVIGRPEGELTLDVRMREVKLNPPIAERDLALATDARGGARGGRE